MVQGIEQLNRKLKVAIPAKVEAATRKAMEKGAQELVGMMKRLAPVDQGDLRDSIAWKWGKAPKGAFTLAKSRTEEFGGMVLTVYATDFKARWVEFGTRDRNKTGSGKKNVGPAQPFFFPSYRSLKKRIKSRVTREMKKAIKAEGGE